MRLLTLFLAAAVTQGALRVDLDERIEITLSRKSAEPRWVESIIAQALGEIQQSCADGMTSVPPAPAAQKFRNIAHQFLRASGRSTIDVRFLACPANMSAVTLGAMIVVNMNWLVRASDDDIWAVAAHEMAHRPSDFARRVVIGLHIPGLAPSAKDDLVTAIEMKADAGALFLLSVAGRDPRSLRRFLEAEQKKAPSPQLSRRLEAL